MANKRNQEGSNKISSDIASFSSEKVREIIRSELLSLCLLGKEKPQTRAGRILGFLNSSFGLWLVGTILVGGFTYAYTVATNAIRERSDREARLEKIETELELRFAPIFHGMDGIGFKRMFEGGATVIESVAPIKHAKVLFSANDEDSRRFFQQEFASYSPRSLMAEAYFLSNGAERISIRIAIDDLDRAQREAKALFPLFSDEDLTIPIDRERDTLEQIWRGRIRFESALLNANFGLKDRANFAQRHDQDRLTNRPEKMIEAAGLINIVHYKDLGWDQAMPEEPKAEKVEASGAARP